MQATGTATDPLGLSDIDIRTLPAPSGSSVHTIKGSFLKTRINWGNAVTENQQGPDIAGLYDPIGPGTFGFTATAMRDARSTGIRVYKMPLSAGTVILAMWNSTGTLLASTSATWVADDGGWREYSFPAPVDMDAEGIYNWGYYYPAADGNYAITPYVYNTQDTCVYPLLMKQYGVTGAGVPTGGQWAKMGSGLQFSNLSADRKGHNYYVDPLVEFDVSHRPAYISGLDFYDQFPNGGSRFAFPIGVYWADPPYLVEYASIGVNTLFAGSVSPSYRTALIASDMDWYPTLHGNDMSAPQAVQEDAEYALRIRGYMITDEPEFNNPWLPPSTLRTWRNNARKIDSTRPSMLNISRISMENQGFVWMPVGVSARDWNMGIREYMSLADMGSLDCYGIDHTQPFTLSSVSYNRYGIWIYPLVIDRMKREITDHNMPIMGVVETTSAYPNSPTPEQVKRAVWASLIPGATAIEYFDHRFGGPAVTQDFAAMLHDPPMKSAIHALNDRMASLADALLAPEANLIAGYTSTGTMSDAQGGYAAGAKIPMHYSSRVVDDTTYFFCQSIRDGETDATFYVPGFQGAVLTVIDESRTVTVDGTGHFTDSFDDGDYTYHLYSTTDEPAFEPPNNTVAPAIIDDGAPETGDTVTVTTGTWDGVPLPTYTFQWQMSTDSGVSWDDLSGATAQAYVLLVSDEDNQVRCVVTATNSEGSDSEPSNVIEPTAPTGPPPSAYAATVLAKTPGFYARLDDLTDSSGNDNHLTVSSGTPTAATGLITDTTDGGQAFDGTGATGMGTADDAVFRTGSGGVSVECWVRVTAPANFQMVSKEGDFRIGMTATYFRFEPRGGSGWWDEVQSSGVTLSGGVTYHVVGTFDTSTKLIKIYVNGVLRGTTDATTHGFIPTTSGWGGLYLGDNPENSTTGLANGTLDEVAVYSRVLSAAEILENYDAGIA